MKRKPLTIRQCRKLMARQLGWCAVPGCGVVLVLGPKGQHTNFIDEHLQPRSRGGSEALKNRALFCKEHAHRKTNRPRSKATTIGGDLFEAAKTKAMRKKHRAPAKKAKPRTKAYPWPTSRKIESRGFDKTHRPMRKRP